MRMGIGRLGFSLMVLGFLVGCGGGNGGGGADVGVGDIGGGDLGVEVGSDLTGEVVGEVAGDVGAELAGDVAPEVVLPQCEAWSDPWGGQEKLFVDRSAAWGLDDAGLNVLGNRLAAVDLDGDGYPDLVVHQVGSNDRDDPQGGTFKRRILLNRPDGKGGRTFVDHTVASGYGRIVLGEGVGGLGRAAHFAVFADADNDGDVDLFSGTYIDVNAEVRPGDRSIVMLNDGAGVYSPAPASEVSPEGEWTTTSATWVDYDRDGLVDLWVGNFYAIYGYETGLQDRLFRNNGDGTFSDVTAAMGLNTSNTGFESGTNHRPTYGVSACDVNGDGFTDLLQSSYGRQFNMLWKNLGGKAFLDIAKVVHYDSDDNMDYSDNNFYRCWCHAGSNQCDPMPAAPMINCQSYSWGSKDAMPYRNGGNTFSTLCADLNGDGRNDVYNAEIVHWHIGQSSDPSQILVNGEAQNEHGFEFSRPGREATGLVRPATMASWNEGDIYAAAFDADNDGVMDLYQPSSDYPGTRGWLFRGLGQGLFVDVDKDGSLSGLDEPRVGGLAVADFDRDGDLDVVLAFSTMRCDAECPFKTPVVRLFENGTDGRGNWVRVSFRGKGAGGSNGAGIGARLELRSGGKVWAQELGGGYGHFGVQNTLSLHFGLGGQCYLESAELRWPNAQGSVSTWSGVLPANSEYLVDEESGKWYRLEAGEEPVEVAW